MHSRNPTCYSCHASMDNPGYAPENFNAVGKWRDHEGGKVVDVTGKLSSGEKFTGVRELQRFLKENKKTGNYSMPRSEAFDLWNRTCGLTFKDRVVVDDVISIGKQEETRASGFSFRSNSKQAVSTFPIR